MKSKFSFHFFIIITFIFISCSNPEIENLNLTCVSIKMDSINLKDNVVNILNVELKSSKDLSKIMKTDKFQSIFYFAPKYPSDSFYIWRKDGSPKLNSINYFEFAISNTDSLEGYKNGGEFYFITALKYYRGYEQVPIDTAIQHLYYILQKYDSLEFQGYWTPNVLSGFYKRTNMRNIVIKKEQISFN